MSHRKFERPRHGNLGFLPRKRCVTIRGRIRKFPTDDESQAPHLTAFMCYKAGMTHIVRDLDRPGSKMHKKEIIEAVSVMDCPPIIVVGMVGYTRTPRGLRLLTTVWAAHLPDNFKRNFYKNWQKSKKAAFKKHSANLSTEKGQQAYQKNLNRIKKHCSIVRVIAMGQVSKCKIGQKKGQIMEIQINGGSVADKVEFGTKLFESSVPVSAVFKESEMVDCIAVTKGHGFEGVIHRWGVTRLPRKTHKGLRKVACIGAWHPARVGFTVPRAGQHGFHHRTEANKKIYKIGKALAEDAGNASCDADLTKKAITPMGGFVKYGVVRNEYLLIKGTTPGPIKRCMTLRKPLRTKTDKWSTEQIDLKFIDTSTKFGHGKWQTMEEREKFMGPRKKTALKEKPTAAKKAKKSKK